MFLTTNKLKKRLEKNLARSTRVDVATAWTTKGPALDLLCQAARDRDVEVRAIVGTYGNATHPEALECLCDIGKLRLAENDGAMFHPKVYIFHGSDKSKSCAWIGSANFTGAGFARNEEVVHETGDVAGASDWFERRWRKCGPLRSGAIEEYRMRRRSQGISHGLAELTATRTDVGTRQRLALLGEAERWTDYVAALEACDESWLDEGSEWSVLGETHSYLHTIREAGAIAQERWTGLSPERANMLLGLHDDSDGAWGLLGTLGAAAAAVYVFLHPHQVGHPPILRQLRRSVDRVIQADDDTVVEVAVEVLEEICRVPRFGPGVATRLLALARPDRLVSVNKGSVDGLSEMFGLPRTVQALGRPNNYRRLLHAVHELPWYGDRPGRSPREQQLWKMRAALIDSFVYRP